MTEMEACDASLADAITTMIEWQKGGRVVEDSGILLAIGKSRYPTLYANAAFPITEAVDARAFLRRADEVFSDRRYVVWSRGRDGGSLGALCREQGFVSLGDTPAMAIEKKVSLATTPRVEVSRARDSAAFLEFVEVSKRAYLELGLPEEIADRVLSNGERVLSSSVVAVGRIEKKPVAAAVAITNAMTGVGGVYWVGTVPEARRRGAADAVARFVTNAAFDGGATIVTLQATEAGQPVYRRIGYREVGRYARFLSPPRSESARPA